MQGHENNQLTQYIHILYIVKIMTGTQQRAKRILEI
jgi:hypothetical protein